LCVRWSLGYVGTCCPHLQGTLRIRAVDCFKTLAHWHLSAKSHDFMTKKAITFMFTIVRTSNLIQCFVCLEQGCHTGQKVAHLTSFGSPWNFLKLTVTMFQKLQFRNRNIQWDGEKNLFSHCWVKLCIFMYFRCGHMWSDIHLTCPGCMTTLLFKEIKYLLWEERWYLSELQLAVSWELDVEVLFSYICCIARQHQN